MQTFKNSTRPQRPSRSARPRNEKKIAKLLTSAPTHSQARWRAGRRFDSPAPAHGQRGTAAHVSTVRHYQQLLRWSGWWEQRRKREGQALWEDLDELEHADHRRRRAAVSPRLSTPTASPRDEWAPGSAFLPGFPRGRPVRTCSLREEPGLAARTNWLRPLPRRPGRVVRIERPSTLEADA